MYLKGFESREIVQITNHNFDVTLLKKEDLLHEGLSS